MRYGKIGSQAHVLPLSSLIEGPLARSSKAYTLRTATLQLPSWGVVCKCPSSSLLNLELTPVGLPSGIFLIQAITLSPCSQSLFPSNLTSDVTY